MVALAACEARYLAREQHDLLLIYGDAVGVFQVFFHTWQVVGYWFFALFARDERWYVFDRPRPIERIHGYQVGDDGRLQFLHVFLHARRLELEHGNGAPFLKQFVGRRIVERNVVDVDLFALRFFDVAQRLFDDGECLQPKKIHLDEPDRFDDVSVVFCYNDVFFQVFIVHRSQRCKLGQVVGTDDDAACVNADLPYGVFQFAGCGQHGTDGGIAAVNAVAQFVDVFVAVGQCRFWHFFDFFLLF